MAPLDNQDKKIRCFSGLLCEYKGPSMQIGSLLCEYRALYNNLRLPHEIMKPGVTKHVTCFIGMAPLGAQDKKNRFEIPPLRPFCG